MNRVYGYCRISRQTQSIERQVRNISKAFPEAIIRTEAFTGTKIEGRKELERILREVKAGDTIVFDSVSRMSRNAEEGIDLYMNLYDKGVELVFLKERHIDTASYKKALEATTGIQTGIVSGDSAEGTLINDIMVALVKFMRVKASDDIREAFAQAEKEVTDLHERTKEGIETARRNGKQIGRSQGATGQLKKDGTESKTFQKAQAIKAEIQKKAQDFGGVYPDKDVMKLLEISRGTYYKYKRELTDELNA